MLILSADEHSTTISPENLPMEKHFIDAKAHLLAATTKDGRNL
jgi:hypothetical protein